MNSGKPDFLRLEWTESSIGHLRCGTCTVLSHGVEISLDCRVVYWLVRHVLGMTTVLLDVQYLTILKSLPSSEFCYEARSLADSTHDDEHGMMTEDVRKVLLSASWNHLSVTDFLFSSCPSLLYNCSSRRAKEDTAGQFADPIFDMVFRLIQVHTGVLDTCISS